MVPRRGGLILLLSQLSFATLRELQPGPQGAEPELQPSAASCRDGALPGKGKGTSGLTQSGAAENNAIVDACRHLHRSGSPAPLTAFPPPDTIRTNWVLRFKRKLRTGPDDASGFRAERL